MDRKKLGKEHEILVDLEDLKKKLGAKNSEQARQMMETDGQESQLKELFEKIKNGEEIENRDALISGSFKTHWIYRPAKIQNDIHSEDFAYKEKDEEYNIW